MALSLLIGVLALPFAQAETVPRPIDPANWVTPSDYPNPALRAQEQGQVSFTLGVDAFGRVTDCRITKSSGSAVLDQTTCAIMHRNGRFEPAKDASGTAIASSWSSRFNWSLPR
jgi:protein TonB